MKNIGSKSLHGPVDGLGRRNFLKILGAAGVGLTFHRLPVMAGPFDERDWNAIIPADKKFHPDWVKSLYARGTPQTYTKSKDELRYIGMPVGGIGCGTMYLGGDGRLWNWDIFNQPLDGVLPSVPVRWEDTGINIEGRAGTLLNRDGARYVKPATPADSPDIDQGFALKITRGGKSEVWPLDASGWAEVEFTGQYPIGTVRYSDPGVPLEVKLEAYSPFIPLNADDSGLPATIFDFTVTNCGEEAAGVDLAGWLQNAAQFYSAKPGKGERVNAVLRGKKATLVAMRFDNPPPAEAGTRPDLLVEDFESGYGAWKTEGEAFGDVPLSRAVTPPYQGVLGGQGGSVVNSHGSAPGNTREQREAGTGKLTSAPFKIERKWLSFYLGGGKGPKVGLRLLVDGKVVRTAGGQNRNKMLRQTFDVAEFEGRDAVIEIFDAAAGGAWANVGVDHIVQTDAPAAETEPERQPDFGTMALAVIGEGSANPDVAATELPDSAFVSSSSGTAAGENPIGAVSQERTIAPGQSAEFRFVVAWHFKNSMVPCPDATGGNYYAKRFSDATAVADYVAAELPRLGSETRLWRDTWYDSTLPHWFLDRTFANTSCLATTTSHRFASGRFWGWEGVGCCKGTCTHVWHYAQAVGRLFPEIERDLRERVDFGAAFDAENGVVRYRGEGSRRAIDGQCGRILGVWREHQMSADGGFLARVWPNVKKSLEHVMRSDTDGDGVLDGAQENTLDAAWFGKIAWLTSLSLAALRAGEEMALEQGDTAFAERCRAQYEKGRASLENTLFNGEYFVQIADPQREKSLGTYEACHIDQVHGQSWAWQVNLGRVLDRDKTLSALRALWKYNFAPDVGRFREKFTNGRPYAMAGDAGLVMSTNPKFVEDVYGPSNWQIGYFNECMSGFEHQVASHMIAEGMIEEGLAVTRAVHDRYHGARRNPWNEVECSDHYSRAMASYGTFITAGGFECHGPRRHIGFAPKIHPEDFKCAFTAPEGWGSFSQKYSAGKLDAEIDVRHGTLKLKTVSLALPGGAVPSAVEARSGETSIPAVLKKSDGGTLIEFAGEIQLSPGEPLRLSLS